MRRLLIALVVIFSACASDPPAAQTIGALGSPAAGLAYAEQNCSSCHAVRGASSESFSAPSFEDIANTPGMTGLALHVWLQSPHENMPMVVVDPDHVDDVWAYISSLRREGPLTGEPKS